jgi:hypothetical protein
VYFILYETLSCDESFQVGKILKSWIVGSRKIVPIRINFKSPDYYNTWCIALDTKISSKLSVVLEMK